jgi:hypothetical protein
METIQDVIDALARLIDDGVSPDTPVNAAQQPNYPLWGELDAITAEEDEDGNVVRVVFAAGEPRNYGREEYWHGDYIGPRE